MKNNKEDNDRDVTYREDDVGGKKIPKDPYAPLVLSGWDEVLVFDRESFTFDAVVFDLDGDGTSEILQRDYSTSGVVSAELLRLNKDGDFVHSFVEGAEEAQQYLSQAELWRYNADSNAELVLPNSSDDPSTFSFYEVDLHQQIPVMKSLPGVYEVGVRGLQAPKAVDLDGDGLKDLVFGNNSSGEKTISIVYGKSGGGFEAPQRLNVVKTCPKTPLVKDLDGDKDLDLIVPLQGCGNAYGFGVIINQGGRKFSEIQIYYTGNKSDFSIKLADLDGDGDLDVFGNHDLQIFKNNGQGQFEFIKNAEILPVTSPFLHDFDLDGFADIIAKRVEDNHMVYYRGVGDGSFVEGPELNYIAKNALSLKIGDFNGDQIPDVYFIDYKYDPAYPAAFDMHGVMVLGK